MYAVTCGCTSLASLLLLLLNYFCLTPVDLSSVKTLVPAALDYLLIIDELYSSLVGERYSHVLNSLLLLFAAYS